MPTKAKAPAKPETRKPTAANILKAVDNLAAQKAVIADAQLLMAPDESWLKSMGEGTYIGTEHEAVVYEQKGRTATDWEAIAIDLGFDLGNKKHRALHKKFTHTGNPSTCLKVQARKQEI